MFTACYVIKCNTYQHAIVILYMARGQPGGGASRYPEFSSLITLLTERQTDHLLARIENSNKYQLSISTTKIWLIYINVVTIF